jgi:protein kinase C substrate 80K-H
MGGTTQKSKKGSGNTGLGTFARFDKITVDEDVPADGKGLGSGERISMHYENGQHCWNGPARSSVIILACAEKDEIWKVVEAEKCTYRFEVGTAAICQDNGKVAAQAKDEL